ncbi:MAG: Asp-tRNA(Asn)/Glu-tRNA(Gln) amidotransferase subunit GatA [Candidatus Bathyarchaeota archaeon]|nr:Asp-tRNA(Asn)/Glu-tRNA(Gln) amidotransferase subunit GatA [Candidatus Bathyarchaeota archaeon]
MPKNMLLSFSAFEAAQKIRAGEVSAEEYVAALFSHIKLVDGKIKAFVSTDQEGALAQARAVDKRVRAGEKLGKLAGLGVSIKDNICTLNLRTTCCSRTLEKYVSPYDATVIERIKHQDGIIIGKTNLDEFAMGSSTEHSCFGPTHNPWDLTRVPGGSSGGSAASIAAQEASVALGGDTGGSIRCPSSFCGVTGIKPTYGLVSRYGMVAYANSLEQIGPIGKNVRDCALMLEVIAGHDPRDSTSVKDQTSPYLQAVGASIDGLKVGVPKEFFAEGTDPQIRESVLDAVTKLTSAHKVTSKEVSLPTISDALPAYYIIAMSEASSNLARFDGIRYGYRIDDRTYDWSTVFSKDREYGFGQEVKRRIILGTFALSAGYYDAFYLRAQKIRTLIMRDFMRAFKEVDVLVAPTMPVLPFKIGEKMSDPIQMYLADVDTVPINLAGVPAASVPCGFKSGLPVGLQLIAPHFREDQLIKVASAFERTLNVNRTADLEEA